MKPKNILIKIKETNLKIRTGTNNAVKCSKGNAESPEHRYTKSYIATFCWLNSLDFATEATFLNGSRCDIVIKDWGICLEILGSEGIKDFARKRYPLPTIPIKALPCKDFNEPEAKNLTRMLTDIETTNGDGADYYIKKNREELTCK